MLRPRMSAPDAMRLDQALVERGLAPSRARAQELIRAGSVLLDGKPAAKASIKVGADRDLLLTDDALDYVSRAALKLVGGLDTFGVDPAGAAALDLGSSTGGFTEVLLRRGAKTVFAVDVGRDQLHDRLRSDDRVVSLEGLHARDLSRDHVPEALDLVVCDVSFISIVKALPTPLALAKQGAALVTLVKPQFELGREAIGKNGRVLLSEEEQRSHIDKVITPFLEGEGWTVRGIAESPILGGDGTKEYLLHAEKART